MPSVSITEKATESNATGDMQTKFTNKLPEEQKISCAVAETVKPDNSPSAIVTEIGASTI